MADSSSTNSTFKIIGQSITYLISLICIISAIVGNYKIYKIRDLIFIAKRSRSILFGLNMSLIIAMLSIVTAFIARIHSHSTSPYVIIGDNSSIICYYLFLFFYITKSWMIYYKERWTFYTLQSKWINIIKTDNQNNNWFIINNYKYGSLPYMYKIFGSYHFCAALLAVLGVIGFHLKWDSFDALSLIFLLPFLISIVVYTIIICKTTRLSDIDDIFYIHWESKWHARILFVFLIIFIIHSMSQIIISSISQSIIFTPFFILLTYSIHHISTYSIYNKNYPTNFTTFNANSPETSLQSTSSMESTIKTPLDNALSAKITLENILSREDSLHLFMLHLSKEFSMECLLSYIEISQYLEYVLNVSDEPIETQKHSENKESKEINLPSNLPQSSIVKYDDDNLEFNDKLKEKAYKLYEKYMEQQSEFEINISWQQREALMDVFDNKRYLSDEITIQQIFSLFEICKEEMVTLLEYSRSRFIQQSEFQKMLLLFDHVQ